MENQEQNTLGKVILFSYSQAHEPGFCSSYRASAL